MPEYRAFHVEEIDLHTIRYHRNGSYGAGYFALTFSVNEPFSREYPGEFVGIVFLGNNESYFPENVAVVNTTYTGEAWLAAMEFGPALMVLIERNREQAYDDASGQYVGPKIPEPPTFYAFMNGLSGYMPDNNSGPYDSIDGAAEAAVEMFADAFESDQDAEAAEAELIRDLVFYFPNPREAGAEYIEIYTLTQAEAEEWERENGREF